MSINLGLIFLSFYSESIIFRRILKIVSEIASLLEFYDWNVYVSVRISTNITYCKSSSNFRKAEIIFSNISVRFLTRRRSLVTKVHNYWN